MATLTEARDLAENLFRLHGLAGTWSFGFDRARKRLGYCNYRKRLITVSALFVQNNTLECVRLTLLHEIAHALVGFRHGHDAVWRARCLAIGGDGRRCGAGKISTVGGWAAVCGSGHRFHRCRRPRQDDALYCVRCGVGTAKGLISWRKQ